MDVAKLTTDELLAKAKDVRRGATVQPDVGLAMAKRLAGLQFLDQARRLAKHIVREPGLVPSHAVELRQKWALWTSKNPDAPDDTKHDDALAILDDIKSLDGGEGLETSTDAETLGIAGGICKRKWLVTGQRQILEKSLRYYERGAALGIENDMGYTAINAAFILDQLAEMEIGEEAEAKRQSAKSWREQVRDTLFAIQDESTAPDGPPRRQERWFLETLAEAYFGLQDYENATECLKQAYDLGQPEPWEVETTARQFAALARLQDPAVTTAGEFEKSKAWGVLRAVYGDSATAGAGSLFAGKFGLALSGGGFRASLFHIGVLAALAERDLLRHVEVLSCVSGGSILGAHYYLEVRKLLQDKSDSDITRQDYIELVERLAKDFVDGVQDNIRTRIGNDLWANLKMLFKPGYSRSDRLAELYEQHLYSKVRDDGKRVLRELTVRPKGNEDCKPKYDNWRRSNKVPILILNATALNTGHNWQFTATWMGEPPAFIDSEIDGNYRLRRLWYDREAPLHLRDIGIGQAAAASSCVPGLFTPIELRDLYDDVTVRLVDGGVHDNQGVFGLLDQNCSVMLVSDASGQMSTVDQPSDNPLGVLLRTTSMLQSRVRTAEYREVVSRRRTGRLKGLLFLHLKKGLEVEALDWVGCDNPKEVTEEERRTARDDLTNYGIAKPVQRGIAALRTDLDSFSDLEAHALMTSGYQMFRANLGDTFEGFSTNARDHEWPFLSVKSDLRSGDREKLGQLSRLFDAGSKTFFKIWTLAPSLKRLTKVSAVLLFLLSVWAVYAWRNEPFLSVQGLIAALGLALIMVGLPTLGLGWLVKVVNYRKTPYEALSALGLSLFGWIGTNIHLRFFDPWFLKQGKVPPKDESEP